MRVEAPAWAPLVLVVLLVGSAGVVRAEPAGDAPAGSAREAAPAAHAGIAWIRPEEVAVRADGLLLGLEGAAPAAAQRDAIARIDGDLGKIAPDLGAVLQQARAAVSRSTPFVELEDLQRELAGFDGTLGGWEATLAAEAKRVAEALDEIAAGRVVWLETRARPETAAAGERMQRRVDDVLADLDRTVADLQRWRTQVLEVGDRVSERRAAVATALKRTQAAAATEWTHLLVPGRAPLWEGGFVGQVWSELPRVPRQMLAYARSTRTYVARDLRPLLVQFLVTVILMAFVRRLAPADERRGVDGPAPGTPERPARPYALACLLALLATPWFHPLSPQRFRQLLAIVALVPASRLVSSASGAIPRAHLVGLFVLLLLDRLSISLAPLPAVARASALAGLLFGFVLAWSLARRLQARGGPAWARHVLRAVLVGLAVGLAAAIGGWDHLAALLGRGIVAGGVVAVFVHAATIGLEPMLIAALGTPLLRRSHLFVEDPALRRRRARYVLRVLGVLLWLVFVLRAVGLHAVAVAGVRAFLAAGVSVGALSISIGTVLAFGMTLFAAMLLARAVTGVLEEDVYPRTSLPRGVPVVLSTLARYAVYSLGFLLALAAAGIQLSQLAILLGGLGVGIGLGLQDLVKNFAAGLTLLLERRVHPGDVVQIPGQEIFGRVLSIGMRATLVRGWNGSEVVVPNADLIASAITNWTLSDRLCRLEVPVGVAYGTDPERVIAVLLAAARSDGGLLVDPPPQVLFKGFGQSSLDFLVRAWTDKGVEEMRQMTSDLAIAVHRALRDAEITIPFPQRDLHLTSVSPAAGAALAGVERKE
jgi:small-conductance mechanosensitive channel